MARFEKHEIENIPTILLRKRYLSNNAKENPEQTHITPEGLDAEISEGKYWWIEPVLDKGYVRCVDWMGEDLNIVNAARASYAKESFELNSKDTKLLNFLGREEHTEPYRQATLSFEVKAPLEVARQWFKYCVGSSHTDPFQTWSESSRRYITIDTEFYVPQSNEWRSKPDNNKQGSGSPIDPFNGAMLTQELLDYIEKGETLYRWAMEEMNVAPEVARLFLPAYGMYIVWRWSCSFQGAAHFIQQRLGEGAQSEIAAYARPVSRMVEHLFPNASEAFIKV